MIDRQPMTDCKPEIEWRDLIREPIKLFGFSYLYFLAMLVLLGLLYIWNLNTVGKNSVQPFILKDSTALVRDIPLQSPRVVPPINVAKIGVVSTELISKGRGLYKNSCAACHGESGKGDGPSALMLNPKPRNFQTADGWKNGSKVSQIYKTMQEGVMGTSMASYNYMPPEDIFAVIYFVRTFAEKQPKDTQEELKGLDDLYGLSKGMNVTGQIPIKKATAIIIKETQSQIEKVEHTKKMLKYSSAEGAIVFRKAVNDEKRVLNSLMRIKKIKDINEFINVITADPLQIGFKANVANLSAGEWLEMHRFLITIVGKENL